MSYSIVSLLLLRVIIISVMLNYLLSFFLEHPFHGLGFRDARLYPDFCDFFLAQSAHSAQDHGS